MPRKQFIADVTNAARDIKHISHCLLADDDEFNLQFDHPDLETGPISITVNISEQSDYPTNHDFSIWCDDNTPQDLAQALSSKTQTGSSTTHAKTVDQLLLIISATLVKVVTAANDLGSNQEMFEEDVESEYHDDDVEEDADDDDADIYTDGQDLSNSTTAFDASIGESRLSEVAVTRSRVRRDFKYAKDAGFRIAYFGGLLDGYKCVVSTSIAVRKLGISKEAMEAWSVASNDYLILLIQYKTGYKTSEQLDALDSATLRASLDMRVGASKNYKPTTQQVHDVFATAAAVNAQSSSSTVQTPDSAPPSAAATFRDVFISKALNDLLNDRLLALVRLRASGMSWKGAEDFHRDAQGSNIRSTNAPQQYYDPEKRSGYPAIVDADHLADKTAKTRSFPLIAMQFTLRHFVRCTEFCLACHRQLDTSIEALKPYVCDQPLCLYQYINYGFGPSIEHEVMAQDKVVDLLISFCYASASEGRLKDYPNGLALTVPSCMVAPVSEYRIRTSYGNNPNVSSSAQVRPASKLQACLDMSRRQLLFDQRDQSAINLKTGDWVAIEPSSVSGGSVAHCRISGDCYPTFDTGPLINLPNDLNMEKWSSVSVDKYSIDFDSLQNDEKRGVVQNLINLLPSVKQMRDYLSKQRTPNLAEWAERLPPAALSVLRWILASNRSCIMEVDPKKAVYGMPNWMQFRFAMGAPDKEQRFITAVNDTKQRLKLKHPTLYAWHGSMLRNWHSIIREGLHFNDTVNGRAYGDGVYHSYHCATSLGYSGAAVYHGPTAQIDKWSNSVLKISSAIALNEIVNAPAEFKSTSPHYVVAQLDWIQTRYLFVQCVVGSDSDSQVDWPKFDVLPEQTLDQDPARVPVNINGQQIVIPASTYKTGKRKGTSPIPKKSKKAKIEVIEILDDSDCASVDTEDEDREIFEDSADSRELAVRASSQTDFIPGSLDFDSLPMLPLPTYANRNATNRLLSDFKTLTKEQNESPLHELGWTIDTEKIENIYQWIVELHSFHMFNEGSEVLPLSADMKKHGINSVVLELRFPGSYPMNPPFVRVIRPRFLPFAEGGGGHVTAGGAICHKVLTSDGWLPANSIESVLLQIRMAMASKDPKPARLQIYRGQDSYGAGEAAEAYKRACRQHGWTIPADFDETSA